MRSDADDGQTRDIGVVVVLGDHHLVEDLYEVEAHGIDHSYRLLFSSEGKKGRVLLAVVLLEKKTQKTPKAVLRLATHRRDEWRRRGAS